MDPAPWARTVARHARRVPGYRKLRSEVLPRIRASRTAREVASRVFDFDTKPDRSAVFLSAGNLLAGRGLDNLPVVIVSLVGVPRDRIAGVVEEVARIQVLTAGFRPVFVLETPELGAVRRYGYPVELLIEPSAWSVADQAWEEYACARLASVKRTYQASSLVAVPSSGLGVSGRLLLQSLDTLGPPPARHSPSVRVKRSPPR